MNPNKAVMIKIILSQYRPAIRLYKWATILKNSGYDVTILYTLAPVDNISFDQFNMEKFQEGRDYAAEYDLHLSFNTDPRLSDLCMPTIQVVGDLKYNCSEEDKRAEFTSFLYALKCVFVSNVQREAAERYYPFLKGSSEVVDDGITEEMKDDCNLLKLNNGKIKSIIDSALLASRQKKAMILHGPKGAAGQPSCIAGAQRKLGAKAACLRVGPNIFGFHADILYPVDSEKSYHSAFIDCARIFDIFHFYFRPFYFHHKNIFFPLGMDILSLRAMGKVVIMHFRGSEVRFHSEFQRYNPYNYVKENPGSLTSDFPEKSQKKYYGLMKAICDRILVPDPELQSYCPGSVIVPRAIDLDSWPYVGVSDNDVPLVIHASSRQGVKGTKHILQVVDQLKKEGLKFKFKLVEKMTNEEARKAYSDADIIIDQLRIGWYGVLSVEAMASGKPVITYIREDLKHHLLPDPPLVMTSMDSFAEDLKHLITDMPYRKKLSLTARKYVERVHSSDVVAKLLLDIYEECRNHPSQVDIRAVGEYIESHAFYSNTLHHRLAGVIKLLKNWICDILKKVIRK